MRRNRFLLPIVEGGSRLRQSVMAIGLLISACTYATNPHPQGVMLADARITPCHGHHTDPKACGNAQFNAPLLPKIQAGMTTAAVREIMRHDAERRELDGNTETWFFMSDYPAELMTAITFTDGKVTSLKQVPWKRN
jgi:hypothetical protein